MNGTAKITSNEAAGLYKISQVFFDSSDGTYKTGTVGILDFDAADVALRDDRAVDDIVAFEINETYDGNRWAIIVGNPAVVAVDADETWIHATESDGTVTLSHIGPAASAHLGSGFVINLDVDSVGHVREWKICADGQCGPCS